MGIMHRFLIPATAYRKRPLMNDIVREIKGLSVARQELLQRLLHSEGPRLSRALILPRPIKSNVAPLSFAQQRLWILDRLEPGNVSLNIPVAVRLSGSLNVAALRRSLCKVVA